MQPVAFVLAWLLAQLRTAHRDQRGRWNPLNSFKDIWNGLGGVASDIRDAIGQLVSYVLAGIVGVVAAVSSGLRSLIDNITSLLAMLVNLLSAALGAIRDVIVYIGSAVANLVRDTLSHLGDVIVYIGSAIANLVGAGLGKVADVATYIGAAIANMLSDGLGKLGDVAVYIGSAIANLVRDVLGKLGDTLAYVGGGIVNGITSTGGKLVDVATWFGTTLANKATDLTDAVDTVGEKAVKAGLDHKDDIISALLFGPDGPAVIEAMGGWQRIGEDILNGLQVAGSDAKSAGGHTFNQMLDLFIGRGHLEPGDAPAQASQALAIATAFGLAAQVPALAQGALPFENAVATTHLAGFLGRFAGWDMIIEAGLGGAIALGLRRPLEQHINKQTLTNIPNERTLDELVARRKINAATYQEGHERHGFTDVWTEALIDAAYRPARIFELARIMTYVDLSDDDLQFMLEDAGYRDRVIPPLTSALHNLAKKTSTSRIVSEAVSAYADGFIDAGSFGAACAAAGIAEDEQGILVFAAEMSYANKVKSELLSTYRSRAAADALSDDELRAGLAGLGITGRKADVEVARANIARLKKPVDTAARDREKALNAARATLTSAYKLQFRKGVIDEGQLYDQLVYIGIPDFQAAAIVELTKAEALKVEPTTRGDTPAEIAARVRKDLEAAYVTQFQHDAIDAAALGHQLLAIGLTTAEVEAIVARESAKKIPKPTPLKATTPEMVAKQVQDTLAKAYEEQFLKSLISADELEQDLVDIGIEPDVARARRLLDEARATPKPKPPTA